MFSALANAFCKAGYDVVFVTSFRCKLEYALYEKVKRYSIEEEDPRESFWKRNYHRVKALRQIIKSEKPDVVLSTSPEANFRALFSVGAIPCKTIITIISDPKHEYARPAYAVLAKSLYRLADGIVCQTEEERRWFPGEMQKKCRILYNQVDDSFFAYGEPEERKGVVAVGRAIPLKRHRDIIRAYAKIADQIGDTLTIYGDGPCREELQTLVQELQLTDRVFLPGKVDNVALHIQDAKLFVHASQYEGLPNAVMEAMTLGIPCVLTDCEGGGARELLKGGEIGFLVPTGDVEALAEKMRCVLQDKKLQKELSGKSRARARDFAGDTVFKQWRDYVETL